MNLWLAVLTFTLAPQDPPLQRAFIENHCLDCHDTDTAKGGLDLETLRFDLGDAKTFARWVKVHDRVRAGEMPPAKKKKRPAPDAVAPFLKTLSDSLTAADLRREAKEGRSTWRRLNRYEYENSLRDLLGLEWIEVKEMLPEDGEAHHFNKIGDALDVSHVQMAQYLKAAEYALRAATVPQVGRPEPVKERYYARDVSAYTRRMFFNDFNRSPERATFPVLGFKGQPEVRTKKAPLTVGPADPETREKEAVGVVASCYEPLEPTFSVFHAPRSGRYRIRLCAFSVWVGPGEGKRWYRPNLDDVSKGRRSEPMVIYAERPPRQVRRLAAFDVNPDPTIGEFEVTLVEGETIRPDPVRLFRSRPPNYHNPLAEKDGCPGVAYRWLEVEGPLVEAWPPAGHRLLFGDLPMKDRDGGGVDIVSKDPEGDAERLLRGFMRKAYRRPAAEDDVARFLGVIRNARTAGFSFADAMIAGYSAVLCSPGFVTLEERPGPLDGPALASRLSYFLWNAPPDDALRTAAARGELAKPEGLRVQVDRLLDDPRSVRFRNAFLDYWLDLRRVNVSSPDPELYADYYLDDLLVESADRETRSFFEELVRIDLPARNIVSSDFAFVNERLAKHYGLPPVEGVALRRVPVPPGSPRGGILTQASVLKVTATGTTTSPILRGVWIMERILGEPPPPPPPSVPAVEPDIRGARTIRQQLEKHRTLKTCASCHAKIDPAGFALENFDVVGAWRERYRALGGEKRVSGYGKNGQPFAFHEALPVDASGELPDGRAFKNVVDFKKLLLADERKIARNLAHQLLVYATGAPVRFGDRDRLEKILDRTADGGYGVRSIIREIVLSGLFRRK